MDQIKKLREANIFFFCAVIAYIVGIFLFPKAEGVILISQYNDLVINKDIFFYTYFGVFFPWVIISLIICLLMRLDDRKEEIIQALCWLFYSIIYSILSTLADIEFLPVSICLLISGICGIIYAVKKLRYIEYDLLQK